MPVENELKYVLNPSVELFKQYSEGHSIVYHMVQGYLSDNNRIRNENGLCTFTAKYTGNTGDLIEIETEISRSDFDNLWPKTTSRLKKIRFKHYTKDAYDEEDYVWDIDFFFDSVGNIYFAMAEAEMPPGKLEPKTIPRMFRKELLFSVPRERTSEFSSRMLSDTSYAQAKLQEIKKMSQ